MNDMRISLAPFTAASLETQMDRALAIEQQSGLDPLWNAEHFLRELPHKWELSHWVMLDEHIAGYAILSQKDSQTAHLHRFVMATPGQGHGSEAMRLLWIALSGRYARLTLKIMLDDTRAHHFYERLGFVHVESDHANHLFSKSL